MFGEILVIAALFISPVQADEAISEAMKVYELTDDKTGEHYTLVLINREDRTLKPAYVHNFIAGVLAGAREWYLDLHKRKGSFTNEEEIRQAFENGTERLNDERSVFSILLRGTAREIFRSVVEYGSLLPSFVRGTVRLTTASHQDPKPPLYYRLGRWPKNSPQFGYKMDWGELKNLGIDERSEISTSAMPLILAGLSTSGWGAQGGYLYDTRTRREILTGHPSLFTEAQRESIEVEDGYSVYNQKNLNRGIHVLDKERFKPSTIGIYYLEFLMPESDAEGLRDPKKAKGLLAYYLRLGFKVVEVTKDRQPGTLLVVASADLHTWEKMVSTTVRIRGTKLSDWLKQDLDFDDPSRLAIRRIEKCGDLFIRSQQSAF